VTSSLSANASWDSPACLRSSNIAFFVSIGFPSFYRELTTGTRAMQATPGCTYSLQVVESSGKHPLKALRHKAFMEQDGNTGEPAVSFKGKT
jgi:hypothetical protein